jgi:hypothetical protein
VLIPFFPLDSVAPFAPYTAQYDDHDQQLHFDQYWLEYNAQLHAVQTTSLFSGRYLPESQVEPQPMNYGEPSCAGQQQSGVQPAGCSEWEVSFSDTAASEAFDITSTTSNGENVFLPHTFEKLLTSNE